MNRYPKAACTVNDFSMWVCAICAVGLLLVGCGSKMPTQPDPAALMDALMAPPTAAEIASAAEAFDRPQSADTAGGFEVLDTHSGSFADLSLVAYRNEGLRLYGLVVRPKSEGVYPVVLFDHGGEDGVSAAELDAFLAPGFVLLVPSFRSEPVNWFGETYVSEGEPSPWGGDVADALAMLDCAGTLPDVDLSRVASVGGSRGGAVALLTAERRPTRFRAVVDLFGPTDFFDPAFRDDLAGLVQNATDGRPGVDYLKRKIVDPYMAGALSLADARSALLLRSALYFANRLPRVQIHHGTDDTVVPISQSDRLAARLRALGKPVEYYTYPGKGHDLDLGDALLPRILAFLQ